VKILALDTSTLVTSCALLDGERVLWESQHEGKAGDVLPGALRDVEAAEAIAVGLGPGSFTGLRVGLACAKALAYARRLPIAGASSLQALALGQPGLVYAATEARKGELFAQPFRGGEPQGPVQIVRAAELQLPAEARLVGPRIAPSAANVARLCLLRLRGSQYDAAACFALAPDYQQGFPA